MFGRVSPALADFRPTAVCGPERSCALVSLLTDASAIIMRYNALTQCEGFLRCDGTPNCCGQNFRVSGASASFRIKRTLRQGLRRCTPHNQQGTFAQAHIRPRHSPTSLWSSIPYHHCVSTVYGPRAGAMTRAKCARWCHGGRGKCGQDKDAVVQGRHDQGARLGKVGSYDKQASWRVAPPAWAASRLTL